MDLKDMICRRKSVRSYTDEPVKEEGIAGILRFVETIKPLYPEIPVRAELVTKQQVRCMLPWVTPQLVAIYSEKTPGYLENVGFMFQQLDLYLQSKGLGACWLGMGRMASHEREPDGKEFVMLLGFGHPKGTAQRTSVSQFRRKNLGDISDQHDDRLEPARLAPSSVNSQPWYFVHDADHIHVYCALRGLFHGGTPMDINLIDMGIALSHLYLSFPDTFSFFQTKAPQKKGYHYIGSITL